MKRQQWYTVMGVVVLLVGSLLPMTSATAQNNGPLSYGSSVAGSITAAAPLAFYTFNGSQGDLVHIDVYGQPGGLTPIFDLVSPTQQTLASSQPNTFAANTQDATLALLLPTTGQYSLMVAGANGTMGDFILQLQGRPPVNAPVLALDQAVTVTVLPNAPPQWYSFTAAECPTTLTAFDPTSGIPYTFPYIVKVRDERGATLARWRGGETVEDQVTVAPFTGPYEVEVWADAAPLTGSIALLIACPDEPDVCPPTADGSTAAASDSAAAETADCPECPPCPGDEPEEEREICDDFLLRATIDEDDVIRVDWSPIPGANAAIVAYYDETGALMHAHMVNDVFETGYDLGLWGHAPGVYTIVVSVGSEELGYELCHDATTVTYAGDDAEGPVDWGPAAGDEETADECVIDIVAPRETMANGLQTFFWNDVPGAESYWLRIYGQYDSVAAEGVIAAPATSLTLDVSEASIGVGYSGEPDFYVQVNAMRDGESWCANGVRVMRNP
ncbi:hypothetical protein ACFLYO_11670 [Chloroflexota bacterium]